MTTPVSTGVPVSEVPGAPKSMLTSTAEAVTSVSQRFAPIRRIGTHFCAFHFYADNIGRQVETHHYCSHLNDEVRQCLIYDSEDVGARLIGVEFVISERLYKTLPEDEKLLWHSHEHEVKSGLLFCPELAIVAEKPIMQELVKTFGKTWHWWQYDRGDTLPLGLPKLMGAFYKDGQVEPHLVEAVEKRYSVSLKERGESRSGLEGPGVKHGGLDERLEAGKGFDLKLEECKLKTEAVTGVTGTTTGAHGA